MTSWPIADDQVDPTNQFKLESSQYASGFLLSQTGPVNKTSVKATLRHSTSFSSASASSFGEPDFPFTERSSTMPEPTTVSEDGEDAPWNLVTYHVPWGPGYEGYEPGTLPGPDGACIFLRSPTPLKRQRTTQACEKCRERKAKCSGGRPTCGRCLDRGLVCHYSSAGDSPPGAPKSSARRLTPSYSKEQLKTSLRSRVRRQSVQCVTELGERISRTQRARTLSLDGRSHTTGPCDLARKGSLNSMLDHYQSGLNANNSVLYSGHDEKFPGHPASSLSSQSTSPEGFRFPMLINAPLCLAAPAPINVAHPPPGYLFHGVINQRHDVPYHTANNEWLNSSLTQSFGNGSATQLHPDANMSFNFTQESAYLRERTLYQPVQHSFELSTVENLAQSLLLAHEMPGCSVQPFF